MVIDVDRITRKQAAAAVGVILAGWFVFLLFRADPEKEVRDRVARLAELVSRPRGEANTAMALRTRALSGLFTVEFSVSVRERTFSIPSSHLPPPSPRSASSSAQPATSSIREENESSPATSDRTPRRRARPRMPWHSQSLV